MNGKKKEYMDPCTNKGSSVDGQQNRPPPALTFIVGPQRGDGRCIFVPVIIDKFLQSCANLEYQMSGISCLGLVFGLESANKKSDVPVGFLEV